MRYHLTTEPGRDSCDHWKHTRNLQTDPCTVNSGHRFYSPKLERWLSRDPIGARGGIERYDFVGNAPVSLVDADGQIPTFIIGVVGGIVAEIGYIISNYIQLHFPDCQEKGSAADCEACCSAVSAGAAGALAAAQAAGLVGCAATGPWAPACMAAVAGAAGTELAGIKQQYDACKAACATKACLTIQ